MRIKYQLPAKTDSLKMYVALGLALFVCFLQTQHERILEQRKWIQSIRNEMTVRFSFTHMPPAGHGWDNTGLAFKLKVCFWILCLCISTCAMLNEGNTSCALGALACISLLCAAIAVDGGKPLTLAIVRSSIILVQISSTCAAAAHDISPSLMRQAILLQCCAMLIFIESLEESLLMMLATSIVLNYRNEGWGIIVLPIQMYVLVIVPSHVMGITERFMGKSVESTKTFTLQALQAYLRGMSSYSCIIPAHIMYSAFVNDSTQSACFVIGLVFVAAGFALRLPRIGHRMNRFICPHTLQFHKPHWSSLAPHKRYVTEILDVIAVSIVSALQLMMSPQYHGMFLSLITLFAVALQFSEFKQHMYNRIQGRLWILLGFAIVSQSHNVALCRVLIYMCLAASFTCSLLACANELIYTQLAQENEAESFLSHAVKQKFAAVGGAVSQILVRMNLPLLRTVTNECHIGHARCHASNLYRKLEQGDLRARDTKTFEFIDDQLKSTPVANMLFTCNTQYSGNMHVAGEADWEVIHLVLCELARKDRTVVLVCCCDEKERLLLTLNQAIQNVHVILRRLVKEANARFEANVLVFEMKMCNTLVAATTSVSVTGSPQFRHRSNNNTDKEDVLRTLRFAIVDDNALIRKNVERILLHMLNIPKGNILLFGATFEEAQRFPQAICSQRVDIAIFDQNLDFDEHGSLLGSELVLEAKLCGFKGCCILHSSDSCLNDLMLTNTAFHGAVEKSANPIKFTNNVTRLWRDFNRREI